MDKKKLFKIGFSAPISGFEKNHAKAQMIAVKMAFEEAKKQSFNNINLELEIGDDGGNKNQSINVAEKFISDPLIVGVIGPSTSDAVAASASIYNEAGLAHIAFGGSLTEISQKGYSTFFRIIPNDDIHAENIIRFLDQFLKVKEILLINDDTKFAIGLNKYMESHAKQASIKILDILQVKEDQKLPGIIEKIVKINPKYIFIAGMEPICNLVALKIREKGINSIYIGTDAIKPSNFLTTPGYDIEGPYQSNVCADLFRNEKTSDFANKFKEQYGQLYSVYTAEVYVAAKLLINVLEECGSNVTRNNVIKRISSIKMNSIIGRISFTENGELEQSKIGFYKFANQKDLKFIGFSTDILN